MIDFARVDFVDNLAKHERVENNGCMLDGMMHNAEEVVSAIKNKKEDKTLKDALPDNVTPHLLGNKEIVAAIGFPMQ